MVQRLHDEQSFTNFTKYHNIVIKVNTSKTVARLNLIDRDTVIRKNVDCFGP